MFRFILSAVSIALNVVGVAIFVKNTHKEIRACWELNRREIWIPALMVLIPILSIAAIVAGYL